LQRKHPMTCINKIWISAIDHTRSHLEILKTRVGQGEIGTISFDPSAIIDDHIKELDQIRANVEAAQTT
jgi:hypothetical protein